MNKIFFLVFRVEVDVFIDFDVQVDWRIILPSNHEYQNR